MGHTKANHIKVPKLLLWCLASALWGGALATAIVLGCTGYGSAGGTVAGFLALLSLGTLAIGAALYE